MVNSNITLHLGLHKTGTTYLQNSLDKNELELSKYFIYPSLSETRKNITPALSRKNSDYNDKTNSALKLISRLSEEAQSTANKRVVISEENFMGFPIEIKKRNLYLNRKYRLTRLKSLLIEAKVNLDKIIISLREYSSFYNSMFLEANKRRFISTDDIDKGYLIDFSYIDIINDIKEIFPKSEITVVTYESFKSDNWLLFEKITGLDKETLINRVKPSSNKRSSPGADAYFESFKIQNINTLDKEVKAFIHKQLMGSNIFSKKNNRSNILFTGDEILNIQEKYKEDLEVISGLVDDLI